MREFIELWLRFAQNGDVPPLDELERSSEKAIEEFEKMQADIEELQRFMRGDRRLG